MPNCYLKTKDHQTNEPLFILSKPLKFHPHSPLPPNYKISYGIRYSGIHNQQLMFYGFDLFFQVSGQGLDLEMFLIFCLKNNFLIDWYSFQRTSKERGLWSYTTLIKKLSFPIKEVFGLKYWESLKMQFMKYEWSLMDLEEKEKWSHLFS